MTSVNVLVFFATVTPVWVTGAGSRPRTVFTWLWTSFCATLRSVPRSKTQVIVAVPELSAEDDMYRNPWTPLIACSSGVTTEYSSVCAIGKAGIEISPANKMTAEQTDAKIGLRRKNSNKGRLSLGFPIEAGGIVSA